MGVEVCVSSIFNFQLSTLKAVSETEARHDVLAVRPDLLAQAGDVDVDRTVEHIYFVFPDQDKAGKQDRIILLYFSTSESYR